MTNATHVPHPGLALLRVLLLDDDVFMLDVLADMLGQLGQFDIRSETASMAALGALRQQQPDLLICDLSMPDMDGIEFLRMAADLGFRGGVVLLSGLHSAIRQAAERLALANGLRILGTFSKPLQHDDLRDMIALQRQARAGIAALPG